jgi:molybdenum cofactor synthesis domain-containing protein
MIKGRKVRMTDGPVDSEGKGLRPFKSLISHKEALKTVLAEVLPIERTETVGLDEALSRIVKNPISAPFNVPGFIRATMDGYAVIASDTFGAEPDNPRQLNCTGSVYAGEVPCSSVTKGACIKIATGAMLPEGADAVVMVEDTSSGKESGQIAFNKPVYPAQNVGKEHEDIAEGEEVILAGEVYERPRVAVIPTGNEVVPVGETLGKGQVYDINSYTLSSIVKENGGIPTRSGIANDIEEELEKVVTKAVEQSDLVMLSGGSSVGERDLLVDVFNKLGKVLFHGIQVKPGKPTLCANINGTLVFGMPGYPTSCLSNGYIFIRPVLRKLARLPEIHENTVSAKLTQKIVSSLGRHHFMTVKLEGSPDELKAAPIFKKSGAITGMALADGYIEIESNVDLLEEGEVVEVKLL